MAPRRPTPLVRAGRWARRAAFLVHRWLGIGIGLLLAVWALSGLVMMYVAFPETTTQERLAGLAPLDARECCVDVAARLGSGPIDAASVEMLAGRPVLRLTDAAGPALIDLATGATPQIDVPMARAIAATHISHTTGTEPGITVEPITRDQWTVYGQFRRHQPLYRAQVADEAGTTLYVSGLTGEVVQDTTRHERFWNWLGSVPHWLYFTALREIQPLWYNLVVYASVLGIFLTVTGLYIGLRQYGRGRSRTPYRGLNAWHHWTGLVFGIFTLTWVASGLLSMQPWGLLESEGPAAERAALQGRPMTGTDAAALVAALPSAGDRPTVNLQLAVQQGQPLALAADAHGATWRATLPTLALRPLDNTALAQLGAIARPGVPIASQGLIRTGDAYHYAHKTDAVLPAWRVIYADAEATRLYFDPRTGEGIRKVDAAARSYRWLFNGFHRLDFTGLLRTRPLWDIVTLPLMLGVSLLCVIGCWLGWRRVMRPRRRSRPA